MAKSTQKPLSVKLLEGKKIPFAQYTYPTDLKDAEEVARAVGFSPEQVYKTLVVQPADSSPKSKWNLCIIPANAQLNLKKVAKAIGAKKAKMASHAQAEEVTGLQVGGISALALLNKGFAVYLDENGKDNDEIVISAGVRGTQIKLAVKDLIKLTRAKFAHLSDSSP